MHLFIAQFTYNAVCMIRPRVETCRSARAQKHIRIRIYTGGRGGGGTARELQFEIYKQLRCHYFRFVPSSQKKMWVLSKSSVNCTLVLQSDALYCWNAAIIVVSVRPVAKWSSLMEGNQWCIMMIEQHWGMGMRPFPFNLSATQLVRIVIRLVGEYMWSPLPFIFY